MPAIKYPEGYKAKDVASRHTDPATKVTRFTFKDGHVYDMASDGTFSHVNPDPVDKAIDNAANAATQPTVTRHPTEPGLAAATVTDHTQPTPAAPAPTPRPSLQLDDDGVARPPHTQRAQPHAPSEREQQLERDNAQLRRKLAHHEAAQRGQHEGGKDAEAPAATAASRMAGKYPARTDAIPTVEEVNKAGQS